MVLSKNLVTCKSVHCCAIWEAASEKVKTMWPIVRHCSNELRYIHSVEYFEAIRSHFGEKVYDMKICS